MRTCWRAVHRSAPVVAVLVGCLLFALADTHAPQGLSAERIDVPAVIAGYVGLAMFCIGLYVVFKRALRGLWRAIPRPRDRALADRWESAVLSSQTESTHLVFVRSARRFGRRGAAADCQPYSPWMAPHASWFDGRGSVAPGRWMHATGHIGGGNYGDCRVLYVDQVLETFPGRAPTVAHRHRLKAPAQRA